MLLQGDVFSLVPPPIRFVLFRWNIRWDPKGNFEAPARHASGEEKRVSERIKVRRGVGKAYESAVDELDLDISPRSNPGVRPRQNRLGYERCYLVLVGGEVVTTGIVLVGTDGSHEFQDNVRDVVWQRHTLRGRGFDLNSVLVGPGTACLVESLDVGVALDHGVLEHLEDARAKDGSVVAARRKYFLASLECIITVHDVKLGEAGLVPVSGNEGAQLMGRGSVDAEDLHTTLKRHIDCGPLRREGEGRVVGSCVPSELLGCRCVSKPVRLLFSWTTRKLGKRDFAFAAAHLKGRVRRGTLGSLFRPKACVAKGAFDNVHESMLLDVLPRGAQNSTEGPMGPCGRIRLRVLLPVMPTRSFCLSVGLPLMLL
jgi:hypothetical protein